MGSDERRGRTVLKTLGAIAGAMAVVMILGSAAMADHTDPRTELSPTADPGTTQLLTFGEGTWEFIRNFPPNPGTDVKFFKKRKSMFAAAGTLGQGDEGHVGQRLLRLVNRKGKVAPKWVADHGSANCQTDNTGVTSLQHDVAVTPKKNPRIMFDTTDTTGRCHDPDGGGLELIDISKLHKKKSKPREIHLTRHVGTSHTVTVDATRPWIIYNNSSQSAGQPWVDVLDIRSCLKKKLKSLKAKRKNCRPKVYRIVFQPEWANRIDANGDQVEGTDASCHDITATPGRIYCANLNSTIVIDVKNLTDKNGNIKGKPIKCSLADGTTTKAKVTDCDDPEATGTNEATGWKYVGHVNHAGRNGTHNTNTEYTSKENIAVSHEAEPTPDKDYMFVTDERGGGVVPGGASCTNEQTDAYGNGGVHVFDISTPGEYQYAQTPDGQKAVFIGAANAPSSTFCTAHVMQQLKGEQRFAIAWYTQGTKIVDWYKDSQGRWTFNEIASVIPQNPTANTWASQVFKTKKNDDGTVTYYFMASDITRGIDIFSWTGPRNPNGTPPPTGSKIKRGNF
jgi:hypothetical protein